MAESTRQLHITPEEIEKGKTMACIAYLLFFVPLIIDEYKTNKYVMFHTEQATALFILNIIITVIVIITCGFLSFLYIISLIFVIIGIVNALNGKVQPLPLIGQYGEKFNFVK